jgi:DNA-binding transcriptional MerR regulator
MTIEVNLTVSQVAEIAGCHRGTVLNYERRGYLKPFRDNNNFRRYSRRDAVKLKQILEIRRPTADSERKNEFSNH